MSSNMLKLTLSIFTVLIALKCVTSYTQSLNFDACDTTYYVNGGKSYKLSWSGYKYLDGCQVTFNGYNPSKSLDEYKVCIKATTWDIDNSDVTLKYYTGLLGTYLEKTYSRYSLSDPTYKWCSSSDQYVSVQLTTSSSSPKQGNIVLEVTAVKTYSYDDYNYGTTIGSVIGSIVVVVVVVSVIAVVVRRRRYIATTTYTSPAAPAATVITQSGSQQMGGYATGPAPPPQYSAAPPQYPPANTNYPAGYNTPYSQYPAGGPKY